MRKRLPLQPSLNSCWFSDTFALPAKTGTFYMRSDTCTKPHTQFTCKVYLCFTCIYASSTSGRIHVNADDKSRKLQVTSPAGCRLTFLQFSGEFMPGVKVGLPAFVGLLACKCGYFCLQLRLFWPAIARIFACICAFFACNCGYFRLKLRAFLPAIAGIFACESRGNSLEFRMWNSRKITYGCRQFACILHVVLAV